MNSELQKRLLGLAGRCRTLNGLGVSATMAGLDKVFEEAAKTGGIPKMSYEGKDVPITDVMDMARRKVPSAIQALNALRMENVELYVRATSNFGMMFETVTLEENEQPVIEHSYRNPVAVRYIGEDGGARTVKAVKARKQTFFPLRELHSNEVGYQIRDINQGNDIAAASQATVDIAWDLANKEDMEMFNLLQGGTINGQSYGAGVYGAFRTTGTKLDRTYIPNPRIQTANLPTTNLIINSGIYDLVEGVQTAAHSNVFRFGVIRAIMKYCDSWGNIWGRPIRPTGAILIPSSETTSISDEIQPTGRFYNEVAQGVLQSYTMFEYMGVRWTLIGDPNLAPGACFPILNGKVGNRYAKPMFDEEFVETDRKKNWETRSAMKVFSLATVETWRVNALKVVYSSEDGAGTVTTNE